MVSREWTLLLAFLVASSFVGWSCEGPPGAVGPVSGADGAAPFADAAIDDDKANAGDTAAFDDASVAAEPANTAEPGATEVVPVIADSSPPDSNVDSAADSSPPDSNVLDSAAADSSPPDSNVTDSSFDAAPDASSAPGWCVDGAPCTPANQCHAGALSCASLACVDTGQPLADGTPCSSGTCQVGICSETCNGPFYDRDCLLDPCNLGSCNPIFGPQAATEMGLCQEAPYTDSSSLEGSTCGTEPHQRCIEGACTEVQCTDDAQCGAVQRCDPFSFQCIPDACESFGVSLADGTVCGVGQICVRSLCLVDLEISGSGLEATPGVPFTGALAKLSSALFDPSTLTATIDWGDGMQSPGSVVGVVGSEPFTVTGSHTYAQPAIILVTVTVTDIPSGVTLRAPLPMTVATPYATDVPIGQSSSITSGADGDLWFTESFGGIGRVTPQGNLTDLVLPTQSPAEAITTGADGNLWFTLPLTDPTNGIGRMTPAGTFDFFPLPVQGSALGPPVAAGPDANVWFTEPGRNVVANISPLGSITEFTMPSGGNPTVITAGADGNLWFVQSSNANDEVNSVGLTVAPTSNALGRVSPAGFFDVFPVPDLPSDGFVVGLTLGGDGNLWFTAATQGHYGAFVGRMSVTGAVTEVPIPFASSPCDMATAPDGSVWFRDVQNSTVDHVTIAGALTWFTVPSLNNGCAGAGGIAIASDGTLWAQESTGVARLTPP